MKIIFQGGYDNKFSVHQR